MNYISIRKPCLTLKNPIFMVSHKDVILLHSYSFIFMMGRIKLFPHKNCSLFLALHVSDFHHPLSLVPEEKLKQFEKKKCNVITKPALS